MKIVFIFAHPDDEAYGPFGTIYKLVQQGHKVCICCLCNGSRPNSEHVSKSRIRALKENCFNLGVEFKIWDQNDLTLDIETATDIVNNVIDFYNPEIVYTHNISDINRDHRIVAESTMVACRPKTSSTVKKLYFFEIPASTDWSFNQITPCFQPNEYVSIDEEVIQMKATALNRYETEVYEEPDYRSVAAMITLAKYRGSQIGVKYAECFKLVFSLIE